MEYDSGVSNEELENKGVGALRLAALEGDEKKGCFMAGQCAAMIKEEKPARQIIEEIFAEAEQLLLGGARWVSGR